MVNVTNYYNGLLYPQPNFLTRKIVSRRWKKRNSMVKRIMGVKWDTFKLFLRLLIFILLTRKVQLFKGF